MENVENPIQNPNEEWMMTWGSSISGKLQTLSCCMLYVVSWKMRLRNHCDHDMISVARLAREDARRETACRTYDESGALKDAAMECDG